MPLVRIDRFWRQRDSAIIEEWLRLRELPKSMVDELPTFGFLAFIEESPVAAAFLRRCEHYVGIFDSLITDPRARSQERHEALDQLITRIIELARDLKYTRLIAFTLDTGTMKRAECHGFIKQAHTLLSLTL